MNESLVKHNTKSSVDCEGHSCDLMRYAYSPMALSRHHIHTAVFIYTNASAQQYLCSQYHRIHAAAFTLNSTYIMMPSHSSSAFVPPHLRCRSSASFMPPISSERNAKRIYTAAITQPQSSHSTYLAFTPPHLCYRSQAATFVPPL